MWKVSARAVKASIPASIPINDDVVTLIQLLVALICKDWMGSLAGAL